MRLIPVNKNDIAWIPRPIVLISNYLFSYNNKSSVGTNSVIRYAIQQHIMDHQAILSH